MAYNHEELLADELAGIDDANAGIDPKSEHEEYDQTVNSILLTSLLTSLEAGELEIISTDSASLLSIASQCAFEGGPGVYHARALYSLLDTLIFNDYDICGTVSPRSFKQKDFGADLYVYPNPAENKIQIRFSNVLPDKVRLISAVGAEVHIYFVTSEIDSYDISTLPNGLYLLQIFKGDKLLGSKKIAIVRDY